MAIAPRAHMRRIYSITIVGKTKTPLLGFKSVEVDVLNKSFLELDIPLAKATALASAWLEWTVSLEPELPEDLFSKFLKKLKRPMTPCDVHIGKLNRSKLHPYVDFFIECMKKNVGFRAYRTAGRQVRWRVETRSCTFVLSTNGRGRRQSPITEIGKFLALSWMRIMNNAPRQKDEDLFAKALQVFSSLNGFGFVGTDIRRAAIKSAEHLYENVIRAPWDEPFPRKLPRRIYQGDHRGHS